MIDSHFHLWTEDSSTPEKRAERAEQLREIMETFGVDRLCLMGERGSTVEECRENNRTVGTYVEEYPDLFYGYARADPTWGEDAAVEFRRAVEEDGLMGLKLYARAFLDDPAVFPLAEAAVDMDVPIISHVAHRYERTERKPLESNSDNVRGLAERYPDLKLISAHIGGGGWWEYRIKNVRDLENVYLDTSGSVCDAGQLEMAVEYLGADRLVFGTDTWYQPGVGKLLGADLSPDVKARIAYNMENLIPDWVPNKLGDDEVAAGIERARERFAEAAEPRTETIVDANSFVGHFPFRQVDASPAALVELMDEKGIDRAIVSSTNAVFYRDCHAGNLELADDVRGYEDRLVPFATIDPTYPAWREDLEHCVAELGMAGVKLFPQYHDYAVDDPAVEELLRACADLDVPVVFVATIEDQRQRHPNFELRDADELSSKHWGNEHVDALIRVLKAVPETDVVVANAWNHADRIVEETTTVRPVGTRLRNKVRSGETLFVVNDLYLHFPYQAEELLETVGADRLVVGSKLPYWTFESYYVQAETLPVSEAEKEKVRSGNVLELLE